MWNEERHVDGTEGELAQAETASGVVTVSASQFFGCGDRQHAVALIMIPIS